MWRWEAGGALLSKSIEDVVHLDYTRTHFDEWKREFSGEDEIGETGWKEGELRTEFRRERVFGICWRIKRLVVAIPPWLDREEVGPWWKIPVRVDFGQLRDDLLWTSFCGSNGLQSSVMRLDGFDVTKSELY